MLFALATGNKIAVGLMGAIFIAFALLSAFYLPRRNPNFPGRALGWYVLASFVLFLGMMTAILVFAKEKGGERAEAETPAGQTSNASTETGAAAESPSSPTESTETESESEGGGGEGDAAAGKQVFASAGCSGCHTLEAANATGNVGPNLDQAKPDAELIEARVEHGKGAMPAFGESGQLTKKQIDDVVAFVYSSTH